MEYTASLDPDTGTRCTLYLFSNVKNSMELQRRIANGELDCCIVKAALLADPFQLVVAANKAAVNAMQNRMTTRSLYTEILFCLSTSKNIGRSLSEFGINQEERNIVVAVLRKIGAESRTADGGSDCFTPDSVDGERVPFTRLAEFTDHSLVRKTYNIDADELNLYDLTDSIVSRISCKDFVSIK